MLFFSKIDALHEVFFDVLDEVGDEEAVAERLIIIPSPRGMSRTSAPVTRKPSRTSITSPSHASKAGSRRGPTTTMTRKHPSAL